MSRSREAFEQVIAWKRAQHQRSRQTDVLGKPWVRQLVDQLFETDDPDFGGMLSTMHIEGRLAAAQFEVANQRLAEAARDYNTGTGRGRLLRFVRERAVDGEYARHLSLTATVRKDFDDLSAMVASARNPTSAKRQPFSRMADTHGRPNEQDGRGKFRLTNLSYRITELFRTP